VSVDTDTHKAHRAKAERAALDSLVERLAHQFPELGADQIVHAVRGEYDEYAAAPVREFVPVLVERSVRSELAMTAARHRA
jgi:hypothetical protein